MNQIRKSEHLFVKRRKTTIDKLVQKHHNKDKRKTQSTNQPEKNSN